VLAICVLAAAHPVHIFQSKRYQLTAYRQWQGIWRERWLRTNVATGVVCGALKWYLPIALSLVIPVEQRRAVVSGWITLICFLAASGVILFQDLHMPMKRPLVLTRRAYRLFGALVGVYLALFVLLRLLTLPIYLAYATVPYAVWLAARIMDPVEERINAGFYHEARAKLRAHKGLIKIGIAGSYGKTFTKYILEGLLSEKYSVLITPYSFNTSMGIARTVNDSLEDGHQVFIAEMGAQRMGDIDTLVKLVEPDIGVITAIGMQNIETFGSIANIVESKNELIRALPEDGMAFFATDNGYARRMFNGCERPKRSAAVDPQEPCDMAVTGIEMGPEGMRFVLKSAKGGRVRCVTQLLGHYNAQNIALAAAVAEHLGLTLDEIAARIGALQPVEKRLQLIPGERTVIDDTDNETPYGAAEALSVLAEFPGRRIIVTPGLPRPEEGDDDDNYAFGTQMTGCIDSAILIGDKNTLRALARGMASVGIPRSAIRVAADPDAAEDLLDAIAAPGDTVLYEGKIRDW